MQIGHLMHHASGLAHEDLHFLVARFDQKYGYTPDEGESWIMRFVDKKVHNLWGGVVWYTGLWRSDRGRVYVSRADSKVLVNPDPGLRAAPFEEHQLSGTLSGVWGLDDRLVFAWGVRKRKDAMGGIMFRYDGKAWSEMESPGEVYGMHGLAPNLVYAVGRQGLIARFDGKAWHKVVSPTKSALSAVFVADEDEIYAVGNEVLLQGSVHGFTEVLEAPNHLFGVAKWKDAVWVGAAESGLMTLEENALVAVDPELKAERLEARGELLVSSPEAIAFTPDQKTFKKLGLRGVEAALASQKPMWVK
jgi:hypothetical protein